MAADNLKNKQRDQPRLNLHFVFLYDPSSKLAYCLNRSSIKLAY